MALLAKRVSACTSVVRMASISLTPCVRAASTTCWNRSSAISAPDFDLAEPCRRRAVSGAHHLLRLALAAVGHAPQGPVAAVRDGHARVPELGGDAAVAGVLQHAHAPAVVDLPRDFTPELEVVTLVVDRPALIGLHIDAARVEHLVERLLARFQADVGHADQRQPSPSVGAHAAIRP